MRFHRNAKLGLAGRRELVLAGGSSIRAAATTFDVPTAIAHRWWQRWMRASEAERRTLSCLPGRARVGAGAGGWLREPVYVRRAFANGRLKQTKTRLSRHALPLQAKAIEALDRLPPVDDILFPNSRAGRIDFRSFGRRHSKPAQRRAGIEPLYGVP